MKRLMTILAILLAFSVSASAQVPSSPVSFYAGGALSIPSGPDSFKETFKNGYHGMAGVGLSMSPMIELVGKLEYHAFQFDFTDDLSELSGGTNKMWMYGADVKLSPSLPALPIKPYALVGVGMASISMSEFSGPESLSLSILNSAIGESQTKMYWNIGVGMNMISTPLFSLFAQPRYVNIATDGESAQFIPITIGAKFF